MGSESPTVVYLGNIPPSAAPVIERLKSKFNIVRVSVDSQEQFHQELQSPSSILSSAVAVLRLGTQLTTKLPTGWTAEIPKLAKLPPKLKLLINTGHGLELEDVACNAACGIQVLGTSGGTDATAVIALYLTISAFRKLGYAERAARTGDPAAFVGAMHAASSQSIDLVGKTVGIIGYGRIGKRAGELLAALGMHISYVKRGHVPDDPKSPTDEPGSVVAYPSVDDMIPNVDCVLLSCPYTSETHHIINWERLQKMRRGVYIVNVARGKCVDEAALIKGIEEGIVAGAGLDVYEFEPRISPKLLELDCVAVLPHIGGLSRDSFEKHVHSAFEEVERYFSRIPI